MTIDTLNPEARMWGAPDAGHDGISSACPTRYRTRFRRCGRAPGDSFDGVISTFAVIFAAARHRGQTDPEGRAPDP